MKIDCVHAWSDAWGRHVEFLGDDNGALEGQRADVIALYNGEE
jgi:hypothetical protein